MMDTLMNVAIPVGNIVVVGLIGIIGFVLWVIVHEKDSENNLKPNVIPFLVRICEIAEVIIIACIIGDVVEKFAPRDEKVKEPLPVMTNGCLRVSGTLTFHVMEVDKHELHK